MRRQTADTREVSGERTGACRPDPFHLPARVDYSGKSRAGMIPQTAVIEHDRVVIRRMTAAGAPLYVAVPLSAYRGVLLAAATAGAGVTLRLDHENDDLAIPLRQAREADDILADWQAWSRILRRPLLVAGADGIARQAQERMGALTVSSPRARRVNKFFADRRPRFLGRRKIGGPACGVVHREDEIIARGIAD